jgi:hypothetical protein
VDELWEIVMLIKKEQGYLGQWLCGQIREVVSLLTNISIPFQMRHSLLELCQFNGVVWSSNMGIVRPYRSHIEKC